MYGTSAGFQPAGASPLPFDPTYESQGALNQQQLDQALAALQYQRGRTGYDTGFNAQGQVDLSNPFSQAKLLERTFQQGQRGTTNQMAAGGQLYSGALQRNLDEGAFRYGADFDRLRQAALDRFNQLGQQEQQARTGFAQGNIDAYSDRLGRAEEYRPAPLAAPAAPGVADYRRLHRQMYGTTRGFRAPGRRGRR